MKQVLDYLLKDLKLNNNDVIVIGCSGGPDSMALLNILEIIRKDLTIKLVCAHINHNVRQRSKKEEKFIEDYCKTKDITFESMVIENYGDDNFHNEARTIRYKFFEDIVKKYQANYLMTAHHGDDLMETILMRIVRGSTLNGYSGFKLDNDMGSYRLVRPLIFVSKEEIEEFNKKEKIPYIIDSSNEKDKYTRNRYRKYILPFLKGESPKVHEKFLKYSLMLDEYNDYIESQVRKELSLVFNDGILDIDKYESLDKVLKNKMLYLILRDLYSDDLILINDKHVELIEDLINSDKKNTFIYLPNNIKVTKTYNEISFIPEENDINSYEIELSDYAMLPNGKKIEVIKDSKENGNDICRLDSKEITLPLYVRTRRHGDKIDLKGTEGHKKVKDIFIDSKIPMNDRDLWPIVVDAKDNVVWIPSLKKSKFLKTFGEKCDIILKYY